MPKRIDTMVPLSHAPKLLVPIPTGLKKKGKISFPISAVLFDIYGTLFISGSGDIGLSSESPPEHEAIAKLLKQYHIEMSPQNLMNALIREIEKAHQTLRLKGIEYPEVRIEEIWQRILNFNDPKATQLFAAAYETIQNPVYPMPFLVHLLDGLHGAGIILGIISNAQFYTPSLFEQFFHRSLDAFHFHPDLTLFSCDFQMAKPGSHLFEIAKDRLKQMNIAPETVIYIGNDMRNDILPSKAAGFQTVLFAGDRRSLRMREGDPQTKNIIPDMVVTDLGQLLNTICFQNPRPPKEVTDKI